MIRFVAEITRDGFEILTDISDSWWRWGPGIHNSISQNGFPFRALTTFKTFRRYNLALLTFRAFAFAIYMKNKRWVLPLSFCHVTLALNFALGPFTFGTVVMTLSCVMRVSYMVRYAHGVGTRQVTRGRRTDWRPQKAQNKAALLPGRLGNNIKLLANPIF